MNKNQAEGPDGNAAGFIVAAALVVIVFAALHVQTFVHELGAAYANLF